MNTPTPRTDAAAALTSQHSHDDSFGDPEFGWVTASFARDLERKLTIERARMKKIETALKDAISTYFGADKLVTAERIEAWQFAMKEDGK